MHDQTEAPARAYPPRPDDDHLDDDDRARLDEARASDVDVDDASDVDRAEPSFGDHVEPSPGDVGTTDEARADHEADWARADHEADEARADHEADDDVERQRAADTPFTPFAPMAVAPVDAHTSDDTVTNRHRIDDDRSTETEADAERAEDAQPAETDAEARRAEGEADAGVLVAGHADAEHDAEPADTGVVAADAEPAEAGVVAADAQPADAEAAEAEATAAEVTGSDVTGSDVSETPTELRPGQGDDGEPALEFWSDADASGLRERWRELQLRFIDDPRTVVHEAEALVEEAVNTLAASLSTAKGRLSDWRAEQGNDTERLRAAVRQYRDFLDRLLDA